MIGTAYHLALLPGTRIDEYQIASVLGQGSFGITYLAEDINLGANIAIKEYLPGDWAFRDSTHTVRPKSSNLSESFERGQESFLKEARLLARVAHPNIVKVRRFFRAHGTAYIAMDFVQGKSLGDILNDDYPQGGYPSAALKRLLIAVLDGLGAIHAAGIVHRDIKPGNVVIGPDGNPILVDFGAARNYDRTVAQGMTVIVTPGYAPIEQYSDDGEQGPFTDIYALGALAYRAMTGQPPDAPYKRLGRSTWVPASAAGAGRYPPAILEAIDWALAVQPQDRPQTAAMLLERLRDAPDAMPMPADEPTQLISDATQLLDPSAWRGRNPVDERAEPLRARPRTARETSITASSADLPEAGDTAPATRRKWLPLAAAAVAALVLIGGVGWVVWPRAPLDPVAASRLDEERAAEAARKAAADAEAARADAERQAAARIEAERQAAEAAKAKAAQEAAEAARREAERQAAEAAKARTAQEAAEAERQAAAKAEADRQAAARAEAERQAAIKAEADRQAAAKAEADRQAATKAEAERQAAAKAEADRQAAAAAAKLKANQEAAEAARQEAAKQAAAKAEADRQAAAEAARQKAEAQKAAAKAEADRKAAAADAAKRAKADQAKPITPSRVADARCTDILQNAQLMGAISDDDKNYLRDHCH